MRNANISSLGLPDRLDTLDTVALSPMSAFNLTSIPGAQRVSGVIVTVLLSPPILTFFSFSLKISKTISGLGNLSPNILNGGSAKTEEGAGLLSSFGAATSKGRSIIWDKLLNIIFSVLSSLFSILRKITPSSIRNLLVRANNRHPDVSEI